MARTFNGTNENIQFGSDASVDDWPLLSIMLWVKFNSGTGGQFLVGKDYYNNAWALHRDGVTLNLTFERQWSTSNAKWRGGTSLGNTNWHHVAVTYNRGNTANDPTFWVDGAQETTVEVTAPTGTITSDASKNIRMGESGTGGQDLNGSIVNFVMHNATITIDDVRRHMYAGVPPDMGAVKIWVPMWTSDLTNKGVAVANGTATGTGTGSSPRGVPLSLLGG